MRSRNHSKLSAGAVVWATAALVSATAGADTPFLVEDIKSAIGADSNPRDFVDFAGEVFFTADDGVHGRELWSTNGTAAGIAIGFSFARNLIGWSSLHTRERLEVDAYIADAEVTGANGIALSSTATATVNAELSHARSFGKRRVLRIQGSWGGASFALGVMLAANPRG